MKRRATRASAWGGRRRSPPRSASRSTIEERIAPVMLNRPEKRNALSLALMRELTATLRELGARRDVAAVILTGKGPAFSAGHDLGEMTGRAVDDYREIFDACCELME